MSEPPKLLDRVRHAIRVHHYSPPNRKKHPSAMGADEANAFLTHLAVEDMVSASTQNQALSALLFLYREVSPSRCRGWTISYGHSGRTGFPSSSPWTRCARSLPESRPPPGWWSSSSTDRACGCWRGSRCASKIWTLSGGRTPDPPSQLRSS